MKLSPFTIIAAAAISLTHPATAQKSLQAVAVPLKVVSMNPPADSLTFQPDHDISLTFNMPLKPETVTPATVSIAGRWSGPVPGEFILSNGNRTLTFVRDRAYSAGESVSISLSTSLRGRFGAFTGRGHQALFWVRPKPGSLAFIKTGTLIPGVVPYGAFGGDLDDDGDLDLAVPNENTSDVSIFLNQGADTFTGPDNFGVGFHCSPSEGLDLDGDGIVDLAIANILDHTVSILIGVGDGSFKPEAVHTVGQQPRGLAAFDFDGDGDPDLITANRQSDNLSLLRNNGDGTFAPQTPISTALGGETGLAAADMNRDGILDLVVIGYYSNSVMVLIGDGKGGFTPKPAQSCGGQPWQVAAGDVNGDGRPDAAVVCAGGDSAGPLFGDGAGGLGAYKGYAAGDFPIAVDLADADGDGDLDMASSSYGQGLFIIHRNLGNGIFEKALQLPAEGAGSCTVFHDRDGDGDVDLTGIDEAADKVYLYRQ